MENKRIAWPWWDTLFAVVWVAMQYFGYRGHHWPWWAVAVTVLVVLSAVLRWGQYALRRRHDGQPKPIE